MKKILLLGYSTEPTFGYTIKQFRNAGQEFDVFDLALCKTASTLRATRSPEGLVIRCDGQEVAFAQYDSIYQRTRFVTLDSPARNQMLRKLLDLLYADMENSDALVVNRTSSGASNHNKFLHLEELHEAGFQVPDQVIIGSGQLAAGAIPSDASWISKSCSAMKTEVAEVDEVLATRFSLLSSSPSLFQENVKGDDVRVHVIGRDVFALRIAFEGVDYRFPGHLDKPVYSKIEVPLGIQTSCFTYCDRNRLFFAGFDFKICRSTGDWYVLEANPQPGYDMYDKRLEGAISSSLLHLLATGDLSRRDKVSSEPFVAGSRRFIINPLGSSANGPKRNQ